MIWSALYYDCPSVALLFLLIVPIIWSFFLLNAFRKKRLSDFADPAVLDAVMEKREPGIFWIKVCLYTLAWVCGVFALMQPKGNERYVSTSPGGVVAVSKKNLKNERIRKKSHEVIFLVDASSSMKIADVSEKTRLDLAKEIADDVIRHLKGENVSLFAFTSSTMQIVPSTLDYLFTRLMLQHIDINEGETQGTDIKTALDFIRKRYFSKVSPKTKTLIVFSDGGDTSLAGLTPEQRREKINQIINPISDAEEKNLRVFVVGLGSLEGKEVPGILYQGHPVVSALEEPLLRKLSASGRGELFVAGQMRSFQISQTLVQNIAREESFVEVSEDQPLPDMGERTRVYDLYFQIPLAIAIVALACCLLIPDTRKRIEEGKG